MGKPRFGAIAGAALILLASSAAAGTASADETVPGRKERP